METMVGISKVLSHPSFISVVCVRAHYLATCLVWARVYLPDYFVYSCRASSRLSTVYRLGFRSFLSFLSLVVEHSWSGLQMSGFNLRLEEAS